MVKFRRRSEFKSFAEVSAALPDLYDSMGGLNYGRSFSVGGNDRATIDSLGFSSVKGGTNISKLMFKTKVAPLPPFGSGQPVAGETHFYVNDIFMEEGSTTTPSLVMYKMKQGSAGFGSTGALAFPKGESNPTNRQHKGHVTAISANMTDYISDEEKFTGEASKYGYMSDTIYTPLARSIVAKNAPYIEVEDAYEYGAQFTFYGKRRSHNMSKKELRRKHGKKISGDIGQGEERTVIFLTGSGSDSINGHDASDHYVCHLNDSYLPKYNLFVPKAQIESKIKGISETVIDSTKDYNNQVTPGNSFFHTVKQDKEMLLEGDKGDDPTLIGTCISRFSTKNTLRQNGQSMQMYSYWIGQGDSESGSDQATDLTDADMYHPVLGDAQIKSLSSNAQFPVQETFASYGPMPFPADIFPSYYGDIPMTRVTGNLLDKSADTVVKSSHGLAAGTKVIFPSNSGIFPEAIGVLEENKRYYVSSEGRSSGVFKLTENKDASGVIDLADLSSDTDADVIMYVQDPDDTTNHHDFNTYSNGTIELDLNFENLEAAQMYTDTSNKISLIKRAFIITLGYYKPSASETFTQYLDRHSSFSDKLDNELYLEDAASGSSSILANNRPIMGWSFIKTVGSSQDWADGIHMIDMDKWKLNTNSETSGIGNADIFILESTDTEAVGNACVKTSLPVGNYFTFKVQFTNTQTGDPDRIDYGLFDSKTDKPLAKSDFQENDAGDEEIDLDAKTHHIGDFYRIDIPWTGRATADSTDGMQFWRNDFNDYFSMNDAQNTYNGKGGGPHYKRALWPRYLTLWLTNMNNRCSESNRDKFLENDGGETTIDSDTIRRATSSSVFIDGIRFRNFNYSHSNATIPVDGGWNPNELIISSPQNNTAMHDFAESHDTVKLPGYSFLLFGTDTKGDLDPTDGKDSGLMLHGFKTDLSNNQPLKDSFCFFTTNYIEDAFPTSGTLFTSSPTSAAPPASIGAGAEFYYGGQCRVHTQGGGGGHSGEGTVYGQPEQNAASGNAVVLGDESSSPTGSIDYFTQKGFINFKGQLDGGSSSDSGSALNLIAGITSTYPTIARREMAMASCRVLRNVGGGIFKVDTTVPFLQGKDDTYIAYLYGASYRETTENPEFKTATEGGDGFTTASNIKLVQIIDQKHVKLEWDGKSNLGAPMATEMQLPYLMISPKKFWFGIRIKNWEETIIDNGSGQGQISHRSLRTKLYSAANLVREQSGSSSFPAKPIQNHYGVFGATYNEFLFSDSPTITGAYENAWKHAIDEEESIIDNSDFGFGAFTDDVDNGAFISKLNPKTNSPNIFKMDKLFEAGDVPELGEEVGFILSSEDPVSKHEVIFRNTTIATPSSGSVPSNYVTGEGANNAGVSVATTAAVVGQDTYGIPQFFTVFEDDLPSTPLFSVQPSKEDEFLPEFKWDAGDDDLWYGMIIIDKEPVNSQYHGAILHLPLNDEGIDMRAPSTVAHDNGIVTETFSLDVSTEIFTGNTTFLTKGKPAVIYDLTNATGVTEGRIYYVSETSLSVASSGGTFRLTTSPDGSSIGDQSFGGSNDSSVKVTFGLPFKNEAFKNNTDTNTSNSAYANVIGNDSDDPGELPLCNFEGLAGNCFFFDGSDDHISYDPPSGNTLSQLTTEATFVAHVTPHEDMSGSTNYVLRSDPVHIFIHSNGIVKANVYVDSTNFVRLNSSAIPIDGVTPTAIHVTVDTTLRSGNCKLYINGQLHDESGPRTNAGPGSDGNGDSWDTDNDGAPVNIHVSTNDFRVGHTTNSFHGNIEEVVVYNKCLYPIAPKDTSFILRKPLQEISNGSPISYSARLFMKDYHNIRGGSTSDVATSPSVSYKKAAFRLGD
tara:strand:+ start:1413 stop:6935 length:5523 start_codon:yes stop_codon:yes gene_type:complete